MDSDLEHGQWVVMVRVEEMEKITDEVGGGGVEVFSHAAGLLECAESLGGEFGAVGVGAVGVVEAVGGLVAEWIVGGDVGMRPMDDFRLADDIVCAIKKAMPPLVVVDTNVSLLP